MNIKPTNLRGSVSPPPSKSISHRALVLAALSEPESEVSNLLQSEDVEATLEGLERMGAEFDRDNQKVVQKSTVKHGSTVINCYNSGTSLRLLTGVVSLFQEETTLLGDESLNKRPMQPLVDALIQLGADISTNGGLPPVIVKSPIKNYETVCTIDGSISSQFISSLLILAAVRGEGIETEINLDTPLVSRPYVQLTLQMLEMLNVEVIVNKHSFKVTGRNILPRLNIQIPTDFSSSAFFLVAGALPQNRIVVQNISHDFQQADETILEFLELSGAKVETQGTTITVSHQTLQAFEANIVDSPDLFPILCVLAVAAKGKSKIYGASHLIHKETNRIQAMADNLGLLGVEFTALEDGMIITGKKIQGGVTLNSFGDHRIAMACAILSTYAKEACDILDFDCISVSYPNFLQDLQSLSVGS